jgi:O-antigen/teichoic acid export membrane protein
MISVLVTAGLAFFVRIGPNLVENLLTLLLLVVSTVILYTWVGFTEQIFLARERYTAANVINGGFGLVRGLSAVVACVGFGVDSLQEWALWSFGSYLAVSLVCAAAIWPYGSPHWRVLKDELPLGASLSVSSFFGAMRWNLDIMAMSIWLPPYMVGAYGVARRVLAAAFIVGGTLDRLAYTKLAMAGAGGPSDTLPLAYKYVVYATGLAAATGLALFVVAPALPWIFGKDFGEAIFILQALCWTLIPVFITNIANDALGASDQHQPRMVALIIVIAAGSSLIVWLTFLLGIKGTLIGVYASEISIAAAFWMVLHWRSYSHFTHSNVLGPDFPYGPPQP